MKIQVIEANSNRPLANTKVQLQVKGKDAGFLTVTTDTSGYITLEDNLNGQQIAVTTSTTQASSSDASAAKFITATDGARLTLASSASAKGRNAETTHGGRTSK